MTPLRGAGLACGFLYLRFAGFTALQNYGRLSEFGEGFAAGWSVAVFDADSGFEQLPA